MSSIRLARAGAIRCANRAGAAMRPRAGETRAKQGPDAGRDQQAAWRNMALDDIPVARARRLGGVKGGISALPRAEGAGASGRGIGRRPG